MSTYALIGLIVGILARVALPPTRLVGFWGSVFLGALGGVIGALIASVFIPGGPTSGLHPLAIVLSLVLTRQRTNTSHTEVLERRDIGGTPPSTY